MENCNQFWEKLFHHHSETNTAHWNMHTHPPPKLVLELMMIGVKNLVCVFIALCWGGVIVSYHDVTLQALMHFFTFWSFCFVDVSPSCLCFSLWATLWTTCVQLWHHLCYSQISFLMFLPVCVEEKLLHRRQTDFNVSTDPHLSSWWPGWS